jgi:hypothetical protein
MLKPQIIHKARQTGGGEGRWRPGTTAGAAARKALAAPIAFLSYFPCLASLPTELTIKAITITLSSGMATNK